MTKSTTTKTLATVKTRNAVEQAAATLAGKATPPASAKPTSKPAKAPAKTPAKAERTFHPTAQAAALAAKDNPKTAVLRTVAGFYTGSKRAGEKAGATFMGRVGALLAKPAAKP